MTFKTEPFSNGKVRLSVDDRVTIYPFNPLQVFFDEVLASDEGWYTCVVGNSFGVAKGSTYLKVPGGRRRLTTRPPTTRQTTPYYRRTTSPTRPSWSRTTTRPGYFENGHIRSTSTPRTTPSTTINIRPTFTALPENAGSMDNIYKHIGAMHEHLRYIYETFDEIRRRLDALERRAIY